MIDWLRSFRSASRARHAPVAEGMEPRLLFSADLAGGLLLGADAAAGAEQRTLTADGEYASADATAAATYAALPMSFEANAGQAGEGIDFIAHGGGYGIALDGGHAWLALATESGARTVQLQLVGAREGVQAEGEGLLAARSNYLVGGDASRWATKLANYQAVAYRGVYDGIDVRYYGNQRQLEYDFIVAAGADAGQVRLRFEGAQASLAANGDLLLRVEGTDSELRFKAPVSCQRGDDGALQAVASAYAIHEDGSIGFVLGAYDRSRELVIDPVLDYATYFGGAASEIATDVAVGADGFVYITGRTTSASFPGLANELPGQGTRGNGDIFVAKLTADLSQVVWSTRIGGSADEQANAIAVDANGNVAVTGWTKSTNFPTLDAADSTMGTGLLVPVQDAVIFKLDADGALVFSTYFGGNEDTDSGHAVAFDAAGNVYAAGQASSGGLVLPILSPLLGGSDNAFINKYSPTGTLLYDQLLGGTGVDYATGLAVDAAGNAYVVGSTRSGSLALDSDTITMNGDDAGLSGASDGFLVRLDSAGHPVYATFVGGGDNDAASGVAIAGGGQVYVVGETRLRNSGNLATTAGAYQTTSNAGDNDTVGFLRLYDTTRDGSGSLLYSTLLGHEDGDRPTGVAVMDGRAVIVGRSNSDSFPTTTGADNEDNALFVVVIDPAGQGSLDLVYGTFHGREVTAGGVAVHGREVYVSGGTAEAGYGTPGAHQGAPANTDALVAAFNMNTAPVLVGVNAPGAVEEDSGRTSIAVAGLLTATDADGDAAGIAITGLDATQGTWQYTLDGSTWIDIGAVSAGAALLLPADGFARIGFTPNADYNGTIAQALSFRAWDGSAGTAGTRVDTTRNGGSTAFSADTGSFDMVVTPVNDAPVAVPDRFTILEDERLVISPDQLYGNDVDAEGAQLFIVSVGDASGGTVRLNGNGINGTIHFDPDPDFHGTASFTYVVSDGVNEVTGTVIIRVAPLNDAPTTSPVVLDDVEEDGSLIITPGELLQNAADAEDDALTVTGLSSSNGTVTPNGDGTWTFRPAANYHGGVTFTYSIGDGTSTINGSASLTVTPVNDAPTTGPVTLPDMEEDGSLVLAPTDLLQNAGDADGDLLAVRHLVASNGTVTANGDGTWTFRPPANYHGSVIFTYTISDATAEIAGSASLVVTPVNDAPIGVADQFATDAGRPLTIAPGALVANDTDVEGSPLVVSAVAAGTGGSVTLNADGSITFRPDAGFTGTAGFTYTVSDGSLVTVVPVSIDVAALPEAPSPPAGTEPIPPAAPAAPVPDVPAPAPPPTAENPAPAPVESGAAPAIPPVAGAPAAQTQDEDAAPQRAPRPTPSLQEALGAAPESPIAALNASAMSFGAPAARLALQAEGGRVVDSVVLDRAGLQLIAAQGTDFALAQFGIESRSGASQLAEFQRSIRSAAFEQELDRLREAVREELDFDKSVTISVVSVSLGLSFVYVLWLIRGGVLLGSYLSALPAWRMLDPLPVLARSDEEGEEDDEPLDADRSDSRHTLRGFG